MTTPAVNNLTADLDLLSRVASLAYATGQANRGDLIACLQAGDRIGTALSALVARVKALEEKYEPKPAEEKKADEPHLSALRNHPGKAKKPTAKP